MSKQGKRKITVELPKVKDLGIRPSVFERLGTKKNASKKPNEYCRQWAQNGACIYGKACKFANTHILISPSKQRAANKDATDLKKSLNKDDNKSRLHSTVVVRSGRSPGGEMENWDQNDLEYADTDVLEKRRKQLQRELEIQLKMESGKDARKDKKKAVVSSSSSRSSSSSSVSSSSSGGSSSSSSTRESRKKGKKGKIKRNSSSSPEIPRNFKKKQLKSDPKRDKLILAKKIGFKKDDVRPNKKHDMDIVKKKALAKPALSKKSLSPIKKSGGTPPINHKQIPKGYTLHRNVSKSPLRKDKNRSVSPRSSKDKDRLKDRDKDRDKDRERDKDRFRRSKSPKPRARSKSSQRIHSSHSKDARSSERNRACSPKSKQTRKDVSNERHRKPTPDRKLDRNRDHKDRQLEHRKDIDKDRFERERKDRLDLTRNHDRSRDRKRDQDLKNPRGRERDRGLNKGLKKPTKPTERLLPRPEERLAALAAISNRAIEPDKANQPKERSENHDRSRKPDRSDRLSKRISDRHLSVDRDHADYDRGIERQYDRPHSMERNYNRANDRYDNIPHEDGDHSPSYPQNRDRERHYEPPYDMQPPHGRGYPDPQELPYDDHLEDHGNIEIGFDDRHGLHEHVWDARDGPHDSERPYPHHQTSHKEWEDDGYRGDVYMQDRHWQHREPQMRDWTDKDRELDSQWHGHRQGGNAPGSRRMHDDSSYIRNVRHDQQPALAQQHGSQAPKRPAANQRPLDTDNQGPKRPCLNAVPPPSAQNADTEDTAIPDDLSEISDDPDDILNRDDVAEQIPVEADAEPGTSEPALRDGVAPPKETASSTSAMPSEKKVEPLTEQSEADDGLDSLDFEEISDGELEEDQKIKGLGDALGVDWASLVAEVRKDKQVAKGELNKQSNTSARTHWQPGRVLARIGVSIHMAGEEMVKEIVEDYNKEVKLDSALTGGKDIFSLHPVASIQVAMEKRFRERASLVAGGGLDIGGRALCARRDLALRRRLCRLPPGETASAPALPVDAELYQRARSLLVPKVA